MKEIRFFMAAFWGVAVSGWAGGAPFGTTERAFYGAGEAMVFSFDTAPMRELAGGEWFELEWKRTGDDGKTEKGTLKIPAGETGRVETRLDEPGFVQIEAELKPGGAKFRGGAGVEPEKLGTDVEEPRDFDEFWRGQLARLEKVPVRAKRERWEPEYDEPDFDIYRVSVDCAGPQKVTGYLSVPAGAAAGSCGALVTFQGYGMHVQEPPKTLWNKKQILFEVNAHGYELGKEKEYYGKFFAKTYTKDGKGYAFDEETNRDREACYFNGMALRAVRALQYVKTLREWDGKNLKVAGGSQGGLQCCWAAGLDGAVNAVDMNITWCCNLGAAANPKRIKGWRPEYARALDYYDAVFHAKRFKAKEVTISRAALGDEICPPRGLAALWNALPEGSESKIEWWQGSKHSQWPEDPQRFKYEKKGVAKELKVEAAAAKEEENEGAKGDFRRERISLNGDWGGLKIPGTWKASAGNEATYVKRVTIPEGWRGARVWLGMDLVQSFARVKVDGKVAGEVYYPGGEVDLTEALGAGEHEVKLEVTAKPDLSVKGAYQAPGRVTKVSGKMKNRGVPGDVWLEKRPKGVRLSDVLVKTRVGAGEIELDAGVKGKLGEGWRLEATVRDGEGKAVKKFGGGAKADARGRAAVKAEWKDAKLWDLDTPENLYWLDLELRRADGTVADTLEKVRFGFREFAIDGRDFRLNGTKVHLRSGASNLTGKDKADGRRVEHAVKFAKEMGVNHLLPMEYSFLPGETGYQGNFYRMLSERGMLTSLPLPHAPHFNALKTEEDRKRYAETAEFQIRKFQNEPCIVFYVLNHNYAGHHGAQDPLRMAGKKKQTEDGERQAGAARSAEEIKRIDPTRPVNHHAGDVGEIYSLNLYPNWAPVQERSDWTEGWEATGEKPLHLAEYGIPLNANWTDYRGPRFIFTQSDVMTIMLNEYNAAFLGERAYRATAEKVEMYKTLARVSGGNKEAWYWQIAGYPTGNAEADEVRREYLERNVPDMRARGVSHYLLWDWQTFWRCKPGTHPFDDPESGVELTASGKAVKAASAEVLCRVVGKAGDFTEWGRNYREGETVRKQVQAINDGRRELRARWTFTVEELGIEKSGELRVAPGERADVPVEFAVPRGAAGKELTLRAKLSTGEESGGFKIKVWPEKFAKSRAKVAYWDPEGTLAPLLKEIGVEGRAVKSDAEIGDAEVFIYGRYGLEKSPFKLEKRIAAGTLGVLVMEQRAETLRKLGFRVQEHGVRRAFAHYGKGELNDARGKSTLLAPYMDTGDAAGCTGAWGEAENTRTWRAGNRGTVASVLIEKPDTGDFLPLVSAGFDMQYAPALEYRYGKGRAIFSQLDASGRTESDPALNAYVRKLVDRLAKKRAAGARKCWHAGGTLGLSMMRGLKIGFEKYGAGAKLGAGDLLVVTPGAKLRGSLMGEIEAGLRVAAVGLTKAELGRLFPGAADEVRSGRWHAAGAPAPKDALAAGITAADLHWRLALEGDFFPAEGGVAGTASALKIVRKGKGALAIFQSPAWLVDEEERQVRSSARRLGFALSRLLRNMGAPGEDLFVNVFNGEFRNGGKLWLDKGWRARCGRGEEKAVKVPGGMANAAGGEMEYRVEFEMPEWMLLFPRVNLYLGPVDGETAVELNGVGIGKVTKATNPEDWRFKPRHYRIEPGKFRAGRNELRVKVECEAGGGGMKGRPAVSVPEALMLYGDDPMEHDDPYRYYGW